MIMIIKKGSKNKAKCDRSGMNLSFVMKLVFEDLVSNEGQFLYKICNAVTNKVEHETFLK